MSDPAPVPTSPGPVQPAIAAKGKPRTDYLPRNVVNAPAIKASIARRSAARGDDAPVAAWLANHFFRWLIGSFESAVRIRSIDDCAALLGPDEEPPAWLVKQARSSGLPECYYIDPEHAFLIEKERMLVEFLHARRGTRLADKLQRITCNLAFEMWEREHRRMQARRGKGWVPSSGKALRECLRTAHGTFFEFAGTDAHLREEMAFESYHMQHCLGQFADRKRLTGGYGEQYVEAAQLGRLRLFTLRGADNLPHVTISLRVDGSSLHIDQIKGKQNRPPVHKYVQDTLQFLRWAQPVPERHGDCDSMGLIHQEAEGPEGGGWTFVADLRDQALMLSVLALHPDLIAHFPQPPASLQWLMLGMGPDKLQAVRRADDAVRAAAHALMSDDEDGVNGGPSWMSPWHRPALAGTSPAYHIEGIELPAQGRWLDADASGPAAS